MARSCLLSVGPEAPARAEAVLLLELGFAIGGEGAGGACSRVGVGIGHAASGKGFDGGNGGEDLEELLGDRNIKSWLRRVGLQLDGGGVAVGEQLDEQRPRELRHGGRDASAELGEPAIDVKLGALTEQRREGLGAFGDLGSQGGQLGFASSGRGWRLRRQWRRRSWKITF